MKSAESCHILLILFFLFAAPSNAQETDTARAPKTTRQIPVVVFVCEHGSAKSVVASAYFNDLARKRGLKLRAISRGTNPDEEIAPPVARGLQADGLELSGEKPTRLSPRDAAGAIRVVAFCPLPKGYFGSVLVEQWNDVPSTSEDYSKARQNIVERVKHLLDELKTGTSQNRRAKSEK